MWADRTTGTLGPMRTGPARYVVIGGICGLAWAAGLRGWMAELAAGESESVYSWLTLVLVLLPGLAIGALLGWSAYLRSRGVRGSRWLVFSPVLFASALLDPEIFRALITHGEGSGALIVVATALAGGFALSRRGWSGARAACALVAALGLLLIGAMGGMAAPMSTARGAWVCLLGFTLMLLFCLASVLPYPRTRPALGARSWVALGALCGLAWACALRSFMAAVAGDESGVEWVNTWGYILLPGAVIGGLLGWAEHLRRTGGRAGWRRLALAPLLFAAILFSHPLDLAGIFEDGVGGGAIGVPVIAMLGGFAISGRGPAGARALAGLLFGSGLAVWLLTAVAVGGEDFALNDPHGLWASVLYEGLLVTLALASSVPHRTPVAAGQQGATAERGVAEVPSSGPEVRREPVGGQCRDPVERTCLLEEMRRPLDHLQRSLTSQLGERLSVQVEHRLVPAPDDEQRGSRHVGERWARQVRAAPSRDHGPDRALSVRRGDQRGGGAGAGAEVAESQPLGGLVAAEPEGGCPETVGQEVDVEAQRVLLHVDQLLGRGEQVDQQGGQSAPLQRGRHRSVARAPSAAAAAMREEHDAGRAAGDLEIAMQLPATDERYVDGALLRWLVIGRLL
jgi:hypothetical protein